MLLQIIVFENNLTLWTGNLISVVVIESFSDPVPQTRSTGTTLMLTSCRIELSRPIKKTDVLNTNGAFMSFGNTCDNALVSQRNIKKPNNIVIFNDLDIIDVDMKGAWEVIPRQRGSDLAKLSNYSNIRRGDADLKLELGQRDDNVFGSSDPEPWCFHVREDFFGGFLIVMFNLIPNCVHSVTDRTSCFQKCVDVIDPDQSSEKVVIAILDEKPEGVQPSALGSVTA